MYRCNDAGTKTEFVFTHHVIKILKEFIEMDTNILIKNQHFKINNLCGVYKHIYQPRKGFWGIYE